MGKRALLVIDLQNGIGPLIGFDQLIDKVNSRIAKYRQEEAPIVFIQHEEAGLEAYSESWQLVPTLQAAPDDFYIRKTHADSFHKTDLAFLLSQLDVKQLEICGAEIPYCLDATIKAAFDRGYQLFMVHGAVATEHDDLINNETMIKHYEQIWEDRFISYIE